LKRFSTATIAPEKAFDPPPTGTGFLVPLLLLGSASVLLTTLQLPINLQWAQGQMQALGVDEMRISSGLEALRDSNRVATLLVPILLFLKWSFFAGLLWLAAMALLEPIPFSTLLNLVAYSYAPLVARDYTIYTIVLLRGEEALLHREGLNVAIGLNLLLPSLELPWSALAGNINLFELWFGALLVTGLVKALRQSWKAALIVFLPMWTFVWLFQFGWVALGLSLRSSLGGAM
jgi:hypothetical protein